MNLQEIDAYELITMLNENLSQMVCARYTGAKFLTEFIEFKREQIVLPQEEKVSAESHFNPDIRTYTGDEEAKQLAYSMDKNILLECISLVGMFFNHLEIENIVYNKSFTYSIKNGKITMIELS